MVRTAARRRPRAIALGWPADSCTRAHRSLHRVQISNCGWEQEFFVVDRENYLKRLDLVSTGRTLLGTPPPRSSVAHHPRGSPCAGALPHKGQQTEAHYFGRIPLRVRSYLREVQEQLWALRISCSVLHNEVAPSQHELSPIFSLASQACPRARCHGCLEVVSRGCSVAGSRPEHRCAGDSAGDCAQVRGQPARLRAAH